MKLTSRTAISTGDCKRKRYNLFHARGTGLVVGSESPIDLFIGTLCHLGVENLMKGKSEDEAVGIVLEKFAQEQDTVFVTSRRQLFSGMEDTKALVELLIRAYARAVLPELLMDYTIESVEHERPVLLIDDIVLETKADALLKTPGGRRIVFSLKTTAQYDTWLMLRDRIALQNYTEPWAYDAEGVQMCYLIKGKKGEKFQFQGNTMLYPWRKNGIYTWNWSYVDRFSKSEHTLGSTWTRVKIWQDMSISEWLSYVQSVTSKSWDDRLAYHEGYPWKRVVQLPDWTTRHPNEIRKIMEGLKRQEKEWFAHVDQVKEDDPDSLELHFPREFTDCSSPKGTCQYYDMCVRDIPLTEFAACGFKPRTPHHDLASLGIEPELRFNE